VNAGFASDHTGIPGTARLAMDMLDEGTKKRSALQISEALDRIGARLGTGADLDTAYVSLNTLKQYVSEALEIFGDVILNPAFPEQEFQRLQKQLLAAIQREKVQPNAMAMRVLPRLLYGPDHPYRNPFSGSGTEESVARITVKHLRDFHSAWFKPNNCTLIVVGDYSLAELLPKLERLFGGWRGGAVRAIEIPTPPARQQPAVYLLDRPGSAQSVIFAGNVAPPKSNPDEIAIELANKILGADFTSRINMNLREEKHWTYGARSSLLDARGPRPFFVVAPVQSDKTRDAMLEIHRELNGVLRDRPITKAELEKAIVNQTLRLPGTWETISRIASALTEIVRFGLPDDYYQTYADNVRAQNLESVSRAVAKLVRPDQLVWVVVGDRTKIESPVRELGFGELSFINPDGEAIAQ
ncbi:MAG: insulinase family protein, partial [Verrucomicrobiae bacterium]|nr:insulinase family protein [Verrucomicrobiae bacterium]